jgi:hypothetical protein
MASVSRTIAIRVPVHITLAHVASDTEPGKFYEIALNENNMIFCSCPSWRFLGHRCKHVKAFRARLTKAA